MKPLVGFVLCMINAAVAIAHLADGGSVLAHMVVALSPWFVWGLGGYTSRHTDQVEWEASAIAAEVRRRRRPW